MAQNSGHSIVDICQGSSVVLHADATGAVTYQWYRDGQSIPGAITGDYKASKEGRYSVVGYNSSSCPSPESDITEVRVLSAPSLQFPAISEKKYGDPTFSIIATASNTDKPITYNASPENIVRIDGGTVTILNAGEVEITATVAGLCGPAVSQKQKLKISPADLIISADSKTKYYGDENPEFTLSYSGLKNGDQIPVQYSHSSETVHLATSDVSLTSMVGSYVIRPARITLPNYTVVAYNDGQLQVLKRPLIVRAKDCVKVRDGKVCKGDGVTYSGFTSWDGEQVLLGALSYGGAAVTALKPGKYPIVPYGQLADNYSIQYVPGTLTILDKFTDLKITKTSESKRVGIGDVFEYTLKVENKSTGRANQVSVLDRLPEELDFVSVMSSSQATSTYDFAERSLSWQIPILEPGASLELRFLVKANLDGQVKNTATVSSEETDSEASDNMSSDIKDIESLIIPNVFTPNGDSKNETFRIPKLEEYAQNQIDIFDRSGNMVFRKTDYQNDWTGDTLSEGTYFYVLNVKNSKGQSHVFKGYITLLRAKF